MITHKKTALCYWNAGGMYFEQDPNVRLETEASMFRRAHVLGYTHVEMRHGYYIVGKGFMERGIDSILKRIPKKYRHNKV